MTNQGLAEQTYRAALTMWESGHVRSRKPERADFAHLDMAPEPGAPVAESQPPASPAPAAPPAADPEAVKAVLADMQRATAQRPSE